MYKEIMVWTSTKCETKLEDMEKLTIQTSPFLKNFIISSFFFLFIKVQGLILKLSGYYSFASAVGMNMNIGEIWIN